MGIGRRGEMLMTSNAESANDMRAGSGSLFTAPIVSCVKTQEEKGKKKFFPFRSHVLISLAMHTEAIKRKKIYISIYSLIKLV